MKIAAGHAWNVWPDPEPETVARELHLYGKPHVVIVQCNEDPGDMGEPRMVSEGDTTYVFVPAFDLWPGFEATAAALAALREKVEGLPEPRCESDYGGTYCGGWYAARAAVLSLLAAPLSVREPGLDVERLREAIDSDEFAAEVGVAGAFEHWETVRIADAIAVNYARLAASPERPADERGGTE